MTIEFCSKNKINYLIFRPFNTYGGYDTFSVIQKIINCAKNKTTFKLFNNGISERDFIHVNDLSKLILQIIKKNISNSIINIGTGVPSKIREIVDVAQSYFGVFPIEQFQSQEVSYSKADTQKLRTLIPNYKYQTVLDYMRDCKLNST